MLGMQMRDVVIEHIYCEQPRALRRFLCLALNRFNRSQINMYSSRKSCPVNKTMRNRALIVCVENFYPETGLCRRSGVKRDSQRLHRILSKLGFTVDIRMDIEAAEIHQAFKEASEQSVKECFVGIISSHGEEGVVFGSDGSAVRLAQIYSCFSGKAMEDKSKVFFVQACRGAGLDEGVEVETDSSLEQDDNVSELLSIPIDTAVMYATSPGYAAFMHPLGSVLIQTLCELLEKEGGPGLEITTLLTRLNHRVAYTFLSRGKRFGGKKQMPCFATRCTREVFPFVGRRAEDSSFSFTATKLIQEPTRSRKASIS
ncbi:hypothetical protein DNTS_008583 [Danionella cerebrum]|uniref:Caspase family p20 domain-containing protein n=1 Tax=Danionella cerebrum TaxID=2873325 RepID=A0A553Q695_9TELE|nr:hypothetical protein DNTS_008583 [Danionella translucida]